MSVHWREEVREGWCWECFWKLVERQALDAEVEERDGKTSVVTVTAEEHCAGPLKDYLFNQRCLKLCPRGQNETLHFVELGGVRVGARRSGDYTMSVRGHVIDCTRWEAEQVAMAIRLLVEAHRLES